MSLQRIIWLTSFPKSGNTWLRILLAYYFMPKEAAIDINSIHRFTTADNRKDFFDRANGKPIEVLEDAEWQRLRPKALRLIAQSRSGHHFVKTHCCLGMVGTTPLISPEVTAGAIYVLRNPFDVALSFARHIGADVDTAIDRMEHAGNGVVSEFGIREMIGRWDAHVGSWTSGQGLRLVVLRYEDLVDDTFRAIQPVFQYLGTKPDVGKLRWAIRKASFKELQKQEAENGFRERPATSKQFFTKGKAGGWRDDLTAEQIARITQSFRPALERYYPEMMAELDQYGTMA